MGRCTIKRGVWVTKQCENPALIECSVCGSEVCAEHVAVSRNNANLVCVNCLEGLYPIYALEDFLNGEFENYVYFMASIRSSLMRLQHFTIPIEKLYKFDQYDSVSFRNEYVQYYDDNDTAANLYDS